jgi:subtilisin family serine protease
MSFRKSLPPMVAVLAASFALSACGASVAGPRAVAKGAVRAERPVMQARSAYAEAPAEIVVTMDAGQPAPRELAGGKVIDRFEFGGTAWHLVDVGQKSLVQRAVAAVRGLPGVRAADPNPMIYALGQPLPGDAPDDEYFPLQYGLLQKSVHLAWRNPVGDMVVGVVDTGIDYTHPDLKDRVAMGLDLTFKPGRIFNRKDKNGPLDDNGHGTHCAGIIGALANNGIGIAGVAPGVKLLAEKALDARGGGTSYDVMKGVAHAITNGAKIVSMSVGGTATTSADRKFYEATVQSGALIVAAAGNSADALGFPAAYPGVLSVGATDSAGALARFSNHDISMSLTAPGVGVLSTMPGDAYAKMSGTSMAAPFVAGVAALVWAKHPDWTAQQVKEHLERTASDRGAPGVDPMFGHGEVDPVTALGL